MSAQEVCCVAQSINFEQNLGLPNFRQAKRSFQPVALIPKHRARLRPLIDVRSQNLCVARTGR